MAITSLQGWKEMCTPSQCYCGCLICNFFTIPNLHLWYCLFEIVLSQKLQVFFFFGQMKWELVKNKFKRKKKVSLYSYNCSKLNGTLRVKIGVTIVKMHPNPINLIFLGNWLFNIISKLDYTIGLTLIIELSCWGSLNLGQGPKSPTCSHGLKCRELIGNWTQAEMFGLKLGYHWAKLTFVNIYSILNMLKFIIKKI